MKKFTVMQSQRILSAVLLGTSRGESVGSICAKLSDHKPLNTKRFRSKYYSLVRNKRDFVLGTISELETDGYIVKSPYKKDNIIEMPKPPEPKALTDQDITNLFMGVVRLVRRQNESKIESLEKEISHLRSVAAKSNTH